MWALPTGTREKLGNSGHGLGGRERKKTRKTGLERKGWDGIVTGRWLTSIAANVDTSLFKEVLADLVT